MADLYHSQWVVLFAFLRNQSLSQSVHVLKEEFTKKVLEIISQYEPTEEELSFSDGEKENGHMDTDDNNSVKLKQDPDAKSMYYTRNKFFGQ